MKRGTAPRDLAPSPRPHLGIGPRAWDRIAAGILAVWLVVVLAVALRWHPTPLYSVESDVIGTYIPAAQGLRHGEIRADLYQSKGFGYPLMLAAAARLTGDDYFLAAKIVNVASSVVGAVFTYLLLRGFLGAEAGAFVLVGLLLNPSFARSTIEAGTDMPAFALLIAATFFILRTPSLRGALLSGFLAGCAVITRYNCAFLMVAGVIVLATRPDRLRSLAAYGAGLAMPIGAWLIAARGMGGNAVGDQNVANMAYEIFGRGLSVDEFGSTIGKQFHSLEDVVLHDPALFATRIGYNLATRHLLDAYRLLPVWIGALALPGILLGWRGRPGWPGMALHAALCYLTLAPVFYLTRFGLYLIPFYLSGVVALILYQRIPWSRGAGAGSAPAQPGRPVLLAALLAACAIPAGAGIREALDTAPNEARAAGLVLRSIGSPGDRVMARKPHVAYFAGMTYVPLPDLKVATVPALIDSARSRGARYLFFSTAEQATRPQLGVLGGPGVSLPGLKQIAFRVMSPRSYYALYEFTGDRFAAGSLDSAVLVAARRNAESRPGFASHFQLASELIDRKRYRDALPELEIAERLDPRDLRTARLQAFAHYSLGEYEEAVLACERAIKLGTVSGWEQSQLGGIRMKQGRSGEAIGHFREALRQEPGNTNYTYLLGWALYEHGERAAAIREFEKVLSVSPGHAQARYFAARAWQLEGDPRRALAILDAADPAGPGAQWFRAFADSLRAGGAR